MVKCGSCGAEVSTSELIFCGECGRRLCEECAYFTRFQRASTGSDSNTGEPVEEHHFCKTHFIVYISGFNADVLERMLRNSFIISGRYQENGREYTYLREFRGKELRDILQEYSASWPSDEWKDWNTM